MYLKELNIANVILYLLFSLKAWVFARSHSDAFDLRKLSDSSGGKELPGLFLVAVEVACPADSSDLILPLLHSRQPLRIVD